MPLRIGTISLKLTALTDLYAENLADEESLVRLRSMTAQALSPAFRKRIDVARYQQRIEVEHFCLDQARTGTGS